MPTADTTECRPIGELVRRYLRGVSVDPFARNSNLATYTNDMNPETAAQYQFPPRVRGSTLLIVCHGAAHNDTLCTVEIMTEQQHELAL